MANLCDFNMMVVGKKENIQQFYNAMNQIGDIWMGRGGESEIYWEDKREDGTVEAIIDGWTKWSVDSSMVCNAISMRTEPEKWSFSSNVKEYITLFEACERWNLDMEVYSCEPGCEFQEHYLFRDGELELNEVVSYSEYSTDEFDTLEEFNEEYGIDATEEEFEAAYVERGGFEWNFEI